MIIYIYIYLYIFKGVIFIIFKGECNLLIAVSHNLSYTSDPLTFFNLCAFPQ